MSDVDLGPDKDQANYIVHQDEPINAEPSAAKLADRWETPAKLAYMRNHGEVLHLDKHAYQLKLDVEADLQSAISRSAPLAGQTSVGLEEILKSGRRTLDAALQCAGNRREELDERHEVEGIKWKSGTVLNAKWSGVYLRDFLLRLGMPENLEESASGLQDAHVYFISYQSCEQADKYEVSIPLRDAMDAERSVMLADTMNDKPLSDEHGGPLRVIVPGFIGARSVKWLQEIRISKQESSSFYMTSDYKKLPEDVGSDEKKEAMKENPPLQDTGLQSSITKISARDNRLEVEGYALDGNGDPIAAVEVCILKDSDGQTPQEELIKTSLENDITWFKATLEQEQKPTGKKVWSWTLFRVQVPIDPDWKSQEIVALCRARTSSGNEQEPLTEWNIRGVANQSYGIYRNIKF